MIFRLSQKLNTKIKVGSLREMPIDDKPYADWSWGGGQRGGSSFRGALMDGG